METTRSVSTSIPEKRRSRMSGKIAAEMVATPKKKEFFRNDCKYVSEEELEVPWFISVII